MVRNTTDHRMSLLTSHVSFMTPDHFAISHHPFAIRRASVCPPQLARTLAFQINEKTVQTVVNSDQLMERWHKIFVRKTKV